MSIRKYILAFSLIIMTQAFDNAAVAQVQSTSYGIMLKVLLSNSTPSISIKEAAINPSQYLFLDAREPEEYKVSHIPNASFVGYDKFDEASLRFIDREKPIIVYCTVGKRSEKITKQLSDAGFTNVQNLYGGIVEWANEGKMLYDSTGNVTDRVHTYTKFWGKWLHRGTRVY